MHKKHIVELSEEERKQLEQIVSKGKISAYKRRHAQVLLACNSSEGGKNWTDQQASDAYDVSVRTVERIRQRCVEHGLEDALIRKQSPTGSRLSKKLDGADEARLIQIACSQAPDGRARWTLRLLADELVALTIVDSISHETIRKVLKKMS